MMKGKLSKSDIQYRLHNEEGIIIATSYDGKLSIQNCDEIFGIIDVEKLAYDSSQEYLIKPIESPIFTFGYEQGFNKAIELNKDKLFTIEDMRKALITMQVSHNVIRTTEDREELIQSLRQPTEIDVEVVYQRACCSDNHTCGDEDNCMICTQTYPKLDADGCLILKRI
jgi:hypothetical protein